MPKRLSLWIAAMCLFCGEQPRLSWRNYEVLWNRESETVGIDGSLRL